MPRQPSDQRREAFVQEYLKDFNASRAIRAVGYKGNKPDQAGSDYLSSPKVQAAVLDQQGKRSSVRQVSADKILATLEMIAYGDTREMFGPDGELRKPADWDDATAMSVAGIEFETLFEGRGADREAVGRVAKIKRSDRLKALDMLARHKSLYNDTLNVNVTIGLADRLARARERDD